MKRVEHNIISIGDLNAARHPSRPCFLTLPPGAKEAWLDDRSAPLTHDVVSWSTMADDCARVAQGLLDLGVRKGDRVVVLLRMSVDLYLILSAVQRIGAIAVVVEALPSVDQLDAGTRLVAPRAVVGCDRVLQGTALVPAMADVALRIGVGAVEQPCDATLAQLRAVNGRADIAPVDEDDTALITFTTGSTGAPKGVDRTHGILRAQHLALLATVPPWQDDVDLPVFPIFCLNNVAAGVPTVLPAVDAADPTADDADLLLAQMKAAAVTTATLSPGLLRAVVARCAERSSPFPPLRRVVVGGAPVGPADARALAAISPTTQLDVLYGSTEVEPISYISGEELAALAGSPDDGVDVGHLYEGLDLRLLRPTDGPLSLVDGWASLRVAPGAPGEVVVAGAHVCRRYFRDEEATLRTKIVDDEGRVWHRTGDVAVRDADGRLRLVGRVHNLVKRGGAVLFPVGPECLLRALDGVRQAAYIGVDDPTLGQRALAVLQAEDRDVATTPSRATELARLARRACEEAGVIVDEVRVLSDIPLDSRHRSKVDYDALREALAKADDAESAAAGAASRAA